MSINRGMGKKTWYIRTTEYYSCAVEYYSAMQRNETRSFVETWMDLETTIQTEVNQKEKNKLYEHICVQSRKWCRSSYLQSRNGNTGVENKYMDTKGEKAGGMNWEITV